MKENLLLNFQGRAEWTQREINLCKLLRLESGNLQFTVQCFNHCCKGSIGLGNNLVLTTFWEEALEIRLCSPDCFSSGGVCGLGMRPDVHMLSLFHAAFVSVAAYNMIQHFTEGSLWPR